MQGDALTSLDPRAPFVLDTRELGRRPGSMIKKCFTAPAPAELGIEVLGVPEGSPVVIDVRLEAVMEGVLATGSAQADLDGECVRCLEPIEDTLDVDLEDLYVYDDLRGDSDDDVRRLEGDLLDLEPVLRDVVVLALPFQPLCEPDCPGLCTTCGARLADDPGHSHGEQVDLRWAGLQSLALEADTDDVHDGPHGSAEKE